jgi:predicted XRE-type DNA-binding protein
MNWSLLIKSITDTGLSQSDIRRATGISKAVISNLANGKQLSTSWDDGEALIGLALRAGVNVRKPQLPVTRK